MTTEEQEIEASVSRKKFVEEYTKAREKAAKEGYKSLTGYERLVLEKGDDYLITG